jgi:hypothetical protein
VSRRRHERTALPSERAGYSASDTTSTVPTHEMFGDPRASVCTSVVAHPYNVPYEHALAECTTFGRTVTCPRRECADPASRMWPGFSSTGPGC